MRYAPWYSHLHRGVEAGELRHFPHAFNLPDNFCEARVRATRPQKSRHYLCSEVAITVILNLQLDAAVPRLDVCDGSPLHVRQQAGRHDEVSLCEQRQANGIRSGTVSRRGLMCVLADARTMQKHEDGHVASTCYGNEAWFYLRGMK